MINNKTLAVIIPAHNEANNIANCIDSLLNQSVLPEEIIVVCNACNDDTAKIASGFKSVKVIETSKKGLIYSRNLGFDIAESSILARLNADVICDINWCANIKKDFMDESVIAVAGLAKNKTLLGNINIFTTFWSKIYIFFAESYFGVPILWGANMAISKKAWLSIRDKACINDSSVHEDQDISIHLSSIEGRIITDSDCIVISNETSYFDWPKFKHYNDLRINTKKIHSNLLASSKNRLSILSRICRFILTVLPGLVFYVVSYLNYSINLLLQNLFGKRR